MEVIAFIASETRGAQKPGERDNLIEGLSEFDMASQRGDRDKQCGLICVSAQQAILVRVLFVRTKAKILSGAASA